MKVRDIKAYREMLVNNQANITVNNPQINLGGESEQLREKLYGVEQIRTVVRELTSIAENPYEQIFYEFLQNADDVAASSIYIHFDSEGILVVNNGSPFLTDGAQNRGQLRSFLRIRDYQEPQNGPVIGKYGIGSRLLYGFLCDSNNELQATQRLENAVINNRKGLVLLSWANQTQLEEFIYDNDNINIEFEASHLDNEEVLLTKILYSYYPAYLEEQKNDIDGTSQTLFTREEFLGFRRIFNAFIEQTNPIFDITKGSAIYIPFGNGIYEFLSEQYNQTLKHRLGTALHFLRNVRKININGNNISKINATKIDLGDHDLTLSLLIPNNRADINVNFYQYLPIPSAENSLGFVINTSKWGLLQSRQNIQWADIYNQNLANNISSQIVQKLIDLSENNRPLYVLFLQNFIQSEAPRDSTVKQYFYDNIIEALKSKLPVSNGGYQNAQNINIKSTSLNINPSDVGLDFRWLDESFKDNYGDFESKFGLERCSISDLLSVTNEENIKNWIKKPDTDYQLLLSELKDKRPSFPFIKTSKGNVITKRELINTETIIPLTSKTKDLKDILDVQNIEYTDIALTEKGLLPSFTDDELIKRVTSLLDKDKLNENQKYLIFKTFQTHFIGEEKKLAIFKNREGVFYTLGQLVKNDTSIAPSGILHDFQIAPTEPYFDEYDGYFRAIDKTWILVQNYWERISLNANNFTQIIADFHKLIGLDATKTKLDEDYNWILCSDGTFTNKDEVFYAKKWADEITENDYKVLVEIIGRITDLKVLSFENLKKLSTVNFAELPTNGFTSIKDKIKVGVDTFMFSLDEIRVLNNIKGSSGFFSYFIITAEDQDKYEVRIKENNDIQFFTNDENVNEFLEEYYYKLPKNLVKIFEEDDSLKTPVDANLQTWIDTFSANPVFIDLITNSNENITKTKYLSKCEVNLGTNNEIESYTDKFEGKVIKLMLKEDSWINAFKEKITIDDKKLSHYNYKEEVTGGFKLSELLPKYIGISNTLEEIKKKLKGINFLSKIFEAETYKSETIDFDLTQIKTLSNAEQLSFLIYYRNKENKNKSLDGFNTSNLNDDDIITSIYEHNLICFSEFSNGKNWFAIHNYIDTQSNLFSEEEKLQDFIENWRTTNIKKTQFLKEAGLKTEESNIFKFRTALNENKGAKESIVEIIKSKYWSKKAQDWLKERFKYSFKRNEDVYSTIQAFFDAYAEKYDIDYIFKLVVEKDEIRVKIEDFNEQGFKVIDINEEIKQVWKDIIEEKNTCTFYDVSKAKNISGKIKQEAKIEGEFIENENISEWTNDKRYEKWRDEIMKNKYQIFFSPIELPFQYTLYLGGNTNVIERDYRNGLRAKVERENVKKLYIFEEKGKKKQKLLIEYRDDLFSPADDLTKLLELDYEGSETDNDFSSPEVGASYLNGVGNGNLNAPNWTDVEKEKFEKFKEQLKELLNIDNIDDLLSDMDKLKEILKDQKDEPKINSISGYIGERLILEWMNFTNSNSTTRDDKPDYDLKLHYKNRDYYIEVKTTTGSVKEKDAVTNIFFRPAQQDAVENNRRENYFLVQIGLKDLELFEFYRQFRDKNLEEVKNTIDEEVKKIMNPELVEKIKKNRVRYRLTLPDGLDDPFS